LYNHRNDGYDNADGDYICRVGDVISSPEGCGYEIVDQLGKGTFGQVLKCVNTSDHSQTVAIKIVKNKPAYFQQGLVEVKILHVLNRSFDLRIVKMLDYFVFRKHLCIVFELLSVNLYDVIKHNNFRGLPFNMVKSIIDQLTRQLVCLKVSNVIHCDLKPENILLTTKRNTKIKLIDFGSAAFIGQQLYTYIQSRFYRSVDVILGIMPFTPAIDMWSLGCILAELYLGLPLFPGHSEYDQLCRIIDLMGSIPSNILDRSRNVRKFFKRIEVPGPVESTSPCHSYRLRTREEYEEITGKKEKLGSKKYVKMGSLRELIFSANVKQEAGEAEDKARRERILSFMTLCLDYDPSKRLTPAQAIAHPLFDDTVTIEAVLAWRPRPEEYCMKKLSEDPGSFVHNSCSSRPLSTDSSTLEMTMVAATPVKGNKEGSLTSTQPLQPRNSQRPLSSFGVNNAVNLPDDSMPVSYRPPLSNIPKPKTSSSPVTHNMHQSPTTVFRGGIPFSPGTHRLPPQTSYLFESPQAPRSRALSSGTEPELTVRWP
jgi:serine/threonine protein kinase